MQYCIQFLFYICTRILFIHIHYKVLFRRKRCLIFPFVPLCICAALHLSSCTADTSTQRRTCASRSRWSRATRGYRRSSRGPSLKRAPDAPQCPRRLPTSSRPIRFSVSGARRTSHTALLLVQRDTLLEHMPFRQLSRRKVFSL